MKILFLKLKSNNFAFLFSVLFTIFSFLFITLHNWKYLAFALLSIYFFYKKKKYWLLIISLLILLLISFHLQKPNDLINEQVTENFQILEQTKNGFIVKYHHSKIFISNFNNSFNVGDIVSIKGTISHINQEYQSYFYTQKIINTINNAQISLIQEATGLRSDMMNFINNSPTIYRNYLSLMLLGFKDIANENIYQMALQINVVHLFVISGFHISLLFFICQKMLNFLKIKAQVSASLALVFTLFYLYLINFPLPAKRAFIFLILQSINKYYFKQKYSSLSIFGLSLIIFSLFDPFKLTSISFVLTFGASFIIYFLQEIKFKNAKTKFLFLHISVYFFTLPIIATINQEISILGIFFSFILSPLFILMYIFCLFLWPWKDALTIIFIGFDWILHFCNQLSIILPINFLSFAIVQSIYLWTYLSFIILVQWNYFTVLKIT